MVERGQKTEVKVKNYRDLLGKGNKRKKKRGSEETRVLELITYVVGTIWK